jgi:hypothetical protein
MDHVRLALSRALQAVRISLGAHEARAHEARLGNQCRVV